MRTPAPRPHLSYAPGLDGLRAIAVLAVIAYHADAPWAPGGFLGVDVFFVLSGFLITSLLLAEHAGTGRIHLASFWARRGRRLLPALLVLLAVLCVWATTWADPIAQDRFRGEAFAGLGYFANWHFASTGTSYFDAFGAESPVRHLWSLAIEEQFYLFWPLMAAGLLSLRRFGRHALGTVAILGAIVSAVAMAVRFDGGDPSRVYYGTDTHAFGLLFGASLAVIVTARTRARHASECRWLTRTATWLGLATFGTLLAAIALVPDDSAFTYRGGIVLVSLATVPLVLAATRPGPVGRILSWRPLVAIGLVSYGLYLWHWPIWVVLDEERTGLRGLTLDAARLSILTTVTLASYFLVERPIRRGALRGWRVRVLAPVAAVGVAAAVLATTVAPPVYTPPVALPPQRQTFAPETTPITGPPRKPGLVVVGDSTGGSAVQGFDAVLGSAYHVVPASFVPETAGNFCPLDLDIEATKDAHGVVKEGAPEPACDWSTKWPRIVNAYRPKVIVVMFGLWDASPHRVHGQWLYPGSRGHHDHLVARARCAVETLSATGAHVLFVLSPRMIQVPESWVAAVNRVFTDVAGSDPARVSVVDARAGVERGGGAFRWDGVHLTPEGATAFAEMARGAIDAARDAPPSPPLYAPPACAPGAIP